MLDTYYLTSVGLSGLFDQSRLLCRVKILVFRLYSKVEKTAESSTVPRRFRGRRSSVTPICLLLRCLRLPSLPLNVFLLDSVAFILFFTWIIDFTFSLFNSSFGEESLFSVCNFCKTEMSVISNYIACSLRDCAANHSDGKFNSGLVPRVNWRATNRISMPYQSSTFPLAVGHSSCTATKDGSIRMALVDERLAPGRNMSERSGVLAYDLVQGELVQWSSAMDKSMPDPPTAVLLHGILGSRKNWGTFTRRLAREFPMWQFLLVDLRCHGDSASMKKRGPHTVASTAFDVLKLVAQLRMTPRVLIGHSFGGKVVLSMVEQAAKPLARPVRAWILDATPGKVRAGGDGEDHPAELISFLRKLPKEVSSKREVVNALLQEGFSTDVAQWVVTNLQPNGPGSSLGFSWVFDLDGIAEMYKSYEETNLWKFVENLPRGVHVNFLKAERSLHRWALEDLQRIHAAEDTAAEEGGGVEMHVLEDAGHWVHADNPDGLFRILSSSFGGFKASRC